MDKRKLTLTLLVLGCLFVGGVAGFVFYYRQLTGTIHVNAVFDVVCNLENPEDMIYSSGWDYSALTESSSLLSGEVLRLIVNTNSMNTGSEDAYIDLVVTGEYISMGGSVSGVLTMFAINNQIQINQLGTPIDIPDINAMDPLLLDYFVDASSAAIYFAEVDLQFNGVTQYGDHGYNVDVHVSNGAPPTQ